MSDSELVDALKKMREGDMSSLKAIYLETNNQVYKVLYSYTKNEQLSLDLMQDTYITLIEKINNLRDLSALQKFINTIAINKARDYYRKYKKEILSDNSEEIFDNQLEQDEELLPQEILDNKEKQKIILDIIDKLPIEQKTAVYLYYYNELSLLQVSKEMNCSEGTTKSRLNYARKKIKAEVDGWESKGTKLYSTGVPIGLLLVKVQLGEVYVPAEKIKELFNSIMKVALDGSFGAISIGKSSTIGKTLIPMKKSLLIKIVSGIAITGTIVATISLNTKKPEHNIYYSYYRLGIIAPITELSIEGNTAIVKDLPKDKCIVISNDDEWKDGKTQIIVKDRNQKKIVINLEEEAEKQRLTATPEEIEVDAWSYKEFTDYDIVQINDYDENIVKINNINEERCIEVIPVGKGTTTAIIKDSNGKAKMMIIETQELEVQGNKFILKSVSIKK